MPDIVSANPIIIIINSQFSIILHHIFRGIDYEVILTGEIKSYGQILK